MLDFLRDWGALCVSVVSMGVAALAYVNSRRAVQISKTEHEWKAAEREEAQERDAWCQEQCMAAAMTHTVEIELERVTWAKWGDENGYFRFFFAPDGTPHIARLRR